MMQVSTVFSYFISLRKNGPIQHGNDIKERRSLIGHSKSLLARRPSFPWQDLQGNQGNPKFFCRMRLYYGE
ncbi:hypothetical protein MAR_031837 [Mya arenaria]|uniref:Uncharacterized protein n=1 Tax=Mya arenaria TaxID=6604 RepID=A0ABY7F4Q3_MYAAR|nr:hypothetical protein MAR_031724 [Mya arenaria]WAR17243.1 hypothetical protein MAR_031837 [Mya arenaria]